MANTNIANVKPPKSPNLPIPPTQYSQDYMNQFTDALRLYRSEDHTSNSSHSQQSRMPSSA